jgi:hypothetical protein
MAMYGIEFTIPISQEFLSHSAESVQSGAVSGIPNATGHERLAPLDPVNRVSMLVTLKGSNTHTSLIPSLNSGRDGIEDDRQIENPGMLPSVRDFLAENSSIFIIELMDVVNVMRTLCDQSTLDEVLLDIGKIKFGREFLNVVEKLLLWNANQRILDPVIRQ